MGKRRTGPGARDGGQQGGAGGRQGVGRGDKLGTAQICQCLRGERQGPEPAPRPGEGTRELVHAPLSPLPGSRPRGPSLPAPRQLLPQSRKPVASAQKRFEKPREWND